MRLQKPVTILTGNYGSGKTEVALNLALAAKTAENRVVIADLDIVNPYFRTADAKQVLNGRNVKLIAPLFANTNVDIPALPAEMATCFTGAYDQAILDVGGDPEGAIALGRYHAEILRCGYEMLFVINKNRPDTQNAEDILQLMREVEATSRLSVTGLVNNTNLLGESSVEDLVASQELLREVSEKSGLPVVYTSGREEILRAVEGELLGEPLPLSLYLKLPF